MPKHLSMDSIVRHADDDKESATEATEAYCLLGCNRLPLELSTRQPTAEQSQRMPLAMQWRNAPHDGNVAGAVVRYAVHS
jgi:hypothetical protein